MNEEQLDPTVPPSSDASSAAGINRILRERNTAKSPKKVTVVSGIVAHPSGLQPIHLRDDPLPELSIEDQVFCVKSGARNILKRRQSDLDNYKPKFQTQPVGDQGHSPPPIRNRSVFVDDSAIEIDGEAGETPSTPTTPTHSRPSSPAPTPQVKKVMLKKPRQDSTYKDCNNVKRS